MNWAGLEKEAIHYGKWALIVYVAMYLWGRVSGRPVLGASAPILHVPEIR